MGVYTEQLKPIEIWTVERILGELLVEYGYEADQEVSPRLDWLIVNLAEQIKWSLKCFLIGGSRKFIDEKPVLKRLSGQSDKISKNIYP